MHECQEGLTVPCDSLFHFFMLATRLAGCPKGNLDTHVFIGTHPTERYFGVEGKTGDNWVGRIRQVRLMGRLLAGVEDIVEAMPKAVGRVEEKADLQRIAPVGAHCIRPIAPVGVQKRCSRMWTPIKDATNSGCPRFRSPAAGQPHLNRPSPQERRRRPVGDGRPR